MIRIESNLVLQRKEIMKRIQNYTMIENEMYLGYLYDEFIAFSRGSPYETLDEIWKDFEKVLRNVMAPTRRT